MRIIFIIFGFLFSYSAFAKCDWCVYEQNSIKNEVENFLNLPPRKQLEKIEAEGIKVFILNPDRKSGTPFFQWSTIRVDPGNLSDISKIEGSLGKTLCKGERLIATKDYTIVLNSDAPLSTLLHEYLHVKQIKKDSNWCKISKRLWGNNMPSVEDVKAVRDHEWDVRQTLWQARQHSAFNIEDHIVIAEGMIKEAQMRKDFDPQALEIVKKEKVEEYLLKEVDAFKQFLLKR